MWNVFRKVWKALNWGISRSLSNETTNFKNFNCWTENHVTHIKRLGKFSEGKHRTMAMKIDSDYAKRLILLSVKNWNTTANQYLLANKLLKKIKKENTKCIKWEEG